MAFYATEQSHQITIYFLSNYGILRKDVGDGDIDGGSDIDVNEAVNVFDRFQIMRPINK